MHVGFMPLIVKFRAHIALSVVIVVTSPVFAQRQPLSLCIVDTKTDTTTQYEPSAGPYAAAMYDQLASQKLRNGAALHITVLAASMQRNILPEIRRLNCSWVVQLWFHRTIDQDRHMGDQDSLLFALWNGATQKAIARGSGIAMRETSGGLVPNLVLYSGLARQILKKLNQQR